ncbi:MAG: hypothetical protein AMXMBFR53_15790 [Gemmatimonadota bacterium]
MVSSLGRLLAVVVVGALFLLVLCCAVMIVLPQQVESLLHVTVPSTVNMVRISSALFFIVTLSLWAFDSVGFLRFRHSWMSKAVWGVGVSSILATSVLFYQSPTQESVVPPLQGFWRAQVRYPTGQDSYALAAHEVMMLYMDKQQAYYAHSDVQFGRYITIRALDIGSDEVDVELGQDSGSSRGRYALAVDLKRERLVISSNGIEVAVLQRSGPF